MPQVDTRFYPSILVPSDLAVIETAIRSVLHACRHEGCTLDPEEAARIVFRLYRMGLTDAEKLSMLGARMTEKASRMRRI